MINYLKANKKFYIKVAAIAIPIAIQQLLVSSLNLIDVFMISSLTNESIAGVGAANKLFFLLNLFLFGMSSGSAVLTAQFYGNNDFTGVRKVYGIGLILAIIGATLFSILAIFTPEMVMRIFSKDEGCIAEGVKYLKIVGFSYICTSITFVTVFVLRSTGNVILPVISTTIGISLNIVLNWILIFGKLGFEPMGIEGAATATTIARAVEMTIVIIGSIVLKLPTSGKFKEIFGFHKPLFVKFVIIAFPVVLNEILWSTGVTMYAVVYGHMGTDVMSAMTITQTIEQIAFVILGGIGNACAIIMGNALGANKPEEEVYKDSFKFMRLSAIAAFITGAVLFFASPCIANIYNVTPEIKQKITMTIKIFSVFMTFKSVNMTNIVGVLRAGGDTKFCAILDAAGVWLIGVPLALVTGLVLKLDLSIVYIALSCEEIFKFPIGILRIKTRKWIKNLA